MGRDVCAKGMGMFIVSFLGCKLSILVSLKVCLSFLAIRVPFWGTDEEIKRGLYLIDGLDQSGTKMLSL